ncbi:molybdopterin molybdenumtransferase MoeA [Tessaracoccus sp. MC1865]|uniref:molybdopterin molybdotransferase MoeA n=1 Tax=Tessaracoccus sp. MC1865 TaxID=2760310 RepID=UPI001600507B|nr:gephyrin-like molybdotransferase Glp [Tessaracoccus sp. MC1865]MBB1482473.1 molybdopterin molybdenumtransferase MoeA [Tessaracoccus sp. MC1865]QTO38071.1 molybdopterin molybdenumtransferase MoeA [Tessaracoccus sp. MC1865]
MAWFGRKKEDPVVEEIPEEPRLPEAPALNASGLRSVADHTAYLLGLVEPLEPFGTPLLEAWDQVMCEDIDSMINVPPNSTAKVAGYAVRAADLVDDQGHLAEPLQIAEATVERLPEGAAVVVAAGDVLPRGANAVLPATFATLEDNRAHLIEKVTEGEYVRAAGEHLSVGTRLLSEGEVLDDRAMGLLAGAGIDKVMVRPRPRVVVVSSGEHLVDPGATMSHGDATDANSYMISAAARAAGATVFRVAVHSNDPEALRNAITDQLIRADLVISTTGGRREDYEAVVDVMNDLGLVDSVDVAMSPGRTQTFGLIGEDNERVPMLMLPGNPVSAYVSFHVFARPLIRRLMGARTEHRAFRAITRTMLRSMHGTMHLLRGRVQLDGSIRYVEQVSLPHALGELTESNALILLDESLESVKAGQAVKVWLFDEED